MTQTITRLFDSHDDAVRAVGELARLGIPDDDVSILGNRPADAAGTAAANDVTDINDDGDVSRGASTGAVLGGIGGVLAGLGLLAIPGLGPIVAAGWLAATAAGAGIGAAGGAATGGIVGALKNAGHNDDDANVYSEGVRRGGTLVSARVDDAMAAEAGAVMDRYNAADTTARGTDYRAGGWSRFDDSAPDHMQGLSGQSDSSRGDSPPLPVFRN